jgi:tetratricopeptide (TPR) repeat protein
VLAALVCGLQLTFWENAIVATGEALDLLIFAFVVHSLLQYRLDQKESRLTWLAVVYGLGITNNYAMIGFFPAFLAALIWIKGLAFFNWRFLLRMFLAGLAALSLYLLLPAILAATSDSEFTFFGLLKSYLGYQKSSLLGIPRYIILLSSFTSLLPVLFIGIRWPAQFGEISAIGNALTNLMTHVIHGVFLVACLYVAFDPAFSPRNIGGGRFPLLPLYYLGALAIGYCSGYFLLVFGAKPKLQPWQRPSPLRQGLGYLIVGLICAALVGMPAGLAVRNFPTILANNGKAMSRLTKLTASSLPEQGALVLSDSPFLLHSLQHELARTKVGKRHVLVDTGSMQAPAYHRHLHEAHPDRWPKLPKAPTRKSLIRQAGLLPLLGTLMRSNQVFYLHPSFGYYFEAFHLVPHKSVYEMKRYPTNSVSAPTLTSAQVSEQHAFWQSLQAKEFDPLIKQAKPFTKRDADDNDSTTLTAYVASIYSRAMNNLGVEIQKTGDIELAGSYFDLANKLNPASPPAFHNLEFNKQKRAGQTSTNALSEATKSRLEAQIGGWNAILSEGGPFDEPKACYFLARVLGERSNFRQAAQHLERTLAFEPDNRSARLAYAYMCVKSGFPDVALEQLADFRSRYAALGIEPAHELELFQAEAWARVSMQDLSSAERLLATAQAKFPQESAPTDTLVDIYLQQNQLTNALQTLDRQVKEQPSNGRALVNYASLKIRLRQYTEALPLLEKALKLNPKDQPALVNRALANLRSGRLDDAERDYRSLLSSGASTYQITAYYGLVKVYSAKKNRKQALRYLNEFLKIAPPDMPERTEAEELKRLLKGGKPR